MQKLRDFKTALLDALKAPENKFYDKIAKAVGKWLYNALKNILDDVQG